MADPVLFEVRGRLAVATLNSEASLNSLSIAMIDALAPKLREWAADPKIGAVWLQGAGQKAFCAGGDIRELHNGMTSSDPAQKEKAFSFFRKEYDLDHAIHVYPKPIVVWGHGIVMGGGLGLMAGASTRIVTEATKLAMPEITIGLYPDVGGSYFLNRMPGRTGLFLGLTGARLNAADTLYVRLADLFLKSELKERAMAALEAISWGDDADANRDLVRKALAPLAAESVSALPKGEVEPRQAVVDELVAGDTILEVAAKFRAYAGGDKWIASALGAFERGSPTSAHVIFEQLRRSRPMSLKECFAMENRMSVQFAKHPDFAEGIRALLIDKDNRPQWKPAKLEDVTPSWVAEHFE